jgi:hypothetical protein
LCKFPVIKRSHLIAVLCGLLTALLLAASVPASQSRPALELRPSSDELPLDGYVELLVDPGGRLGLREVSGPAFDNKFRPLPSAVLRLENPGATYWLRLKLNNPQPEGRAFSPDEKWVLELGWPFLYRVRLYAPLPGGKWRTMESGLAPSMEPGVIYLNLPVFELNLKGQQNTVIYVSLTANDTMPIPLKLATARRTAADTKQRMLAYGLYYGILLAMILYNLSMYISLRQPSNLWYLLSVLFLGMYYFSFNGLAYEFAPPYLAALFYYEPTLVWMSLSLLCLGVFSMRFLATRSNSPLGHSFLKVWLWVWLGLPLAIFSLPAVVLDPLVTLLAFLFVVFLSVVGIQCWRRGFKPARFFLLAWFFSALGGVVFSLSLAGLLPYTAISMHSIQIGSAMEFLLLSLALADRVRVLRRERDSFQKSQRRFRDLSVRDGLTGAYNKRHLMSTLPQLINTTSSDEHALAVAILDLDDF